MYFCVQYVPKWDKKINRFNEIKYPIRISAFDKCDEKNHQNDD